MNKELKRLYKAKSALDTAIHLMEEKIRPYVDFDFFIDFQASDGFVIVANFHQRFHPDNAPLEYCLEAIAKYGRLSKEEYKMHSI